MRHTETDEPVAKVAKEKPSSSAPLIDPRVSAIVPGFDAPFFQAGLAGYSDGAMRIIARRHGCPYCITEAYLDRVLIEGRKVRERDNPDRLAALAGVEDHPIAGQIMGTEPDEMAAAARVLVQMGHDVVDVNFACPVKKVKKKNRGGHFLTAPDDAIAVLAAVRVAVPTAVPVTVKLRRSWDDSDEMARNFERIFNGAYELGCAWATVHARTVEQKYVGPARWEFLTDLVRRHPEKIIFGSGDIWTVRDIIAMLESTGVSAVSVARGCIGNPWIFRQARDLLAGRDPKPPSIAEQRRALLEHLELSTTIHGEEAASRMMRKFGIKFSAHHPDPPAVKDAFIRCRCLPDWRAVLARHYDDDER